FEYGPFDTLIRVADAKRNVVSMTYDGLGRRKTLVDGDIGTVKTVYDGFSQVVAETDALSTTTMRYDDVGRLRERTAPDAKDTFTYDQGEKALGKLSLKRRDASGVKPVSTSYEYDSLGRLGRETWTIADETYQLAYTYDLQGRLLTTGYPRVPGEPRFT